MTSNLSGNNVTLECGAAWQSSRLTESNPTKTHPSAHTALTVYVNLEMGAIQLAGYFSVELSFLLFFYFSLVFEGLLVTQMTLPI